MKVLNKHPCLDCRAEVRSVSDSFWHELCRAHSGKKYFRFLTLNIESIKPWSARNGRENIPLIIKAVSIAVSENWKPLPRLPWWVLHCHASTAESSIQNVTEPRLHKASLYSLQFAIFFFDLPIKTPCFDYMGSDRRTGERFNWFGQQRRVYYSDYVQLRDSVTKNGSQSGAVIMSNLGAD